MGLLTPKEQGRINDDACRIRILPLHHWRVTVSALRSSPSSTPSTSTRCAYTITLHCIALHCIALHCIALHCIALHCIALHCSAVQCSAVQCIAVQCSALHHVTLHYIALHYITLHYITLHYMILYYIILYYITLHHITLHCILSILFYSIYSIIFYYILLHHITLQRLVAYAFNIDEVLVATAAGGGVAPLSSSCDEERSDGVEWNAPGRHVRTSRRLSMNNGSRGSCIENRSEIDSGSSPSSHADPTTPPPLPPDPPALPSRAPYVTRARSTLRSTALTPPRAPRTSSGRCSTAGRATTTRSCS